MFRDILLGDASVSYSSRALEQAIEAEVSKGGPGRKRAAGGYSSKL